MILPTILQKRCIRVVGQTHEPMELVGSPFLVPGYPHRAGRFPSTSNTVLAAMQHETSTRRPSPTFCGPCAGMQLFSTGFKNSSPIGA
eukprot:203500-Rhodomonas_salina.2